MNKVVALLFLLIAQFSLAQNWYYHNPTLSFDVNTVKCTGHGTVVLGGGRETNDSVQVMFYTDNYGQTWTENEHDGLAPWNKSIAFRDVIHGLGVGNRGRVVKTDDGGLHWGYATYPTTRDLNKIFRVSNQTYYAVGGKRGNDSVQVVIKTTNEGNNWLVVYDQPGAWLKSGYFKDTLNGIAVGDSGVIIKTTDGGSNWTPVPAPVNRSFNGITFLNTDTGYIVGGTGTQKTILRTTDGGDNWAIVTDTAGAMLNDITFADTHTGYAVGDSATVLKTTNGGLNWAPVTVSNTLTGNEEIRTVHFYDTNFGAIGGKDGLLYLYLGTPLPFTVLQTDQVSTQTYTAATLTGTVQGITAPMNLFFEYDTTTLFANTIQATPATVSDTAIHSVNALVDSLQPLTTYYYRIKGEVAGNTYSGSIRSFFTSPVSLNGFKTLTATEVTDSSFVLNGQIEGLNYPDPLTVSFDYGTSPALGNSIAAGTIILTDTLPHFVSAELNGLSQDTTVYYYRLKVQAGTDMHYGDTRRVQTNTPEIPNWDFEQWQTQTTQLPERWTPISNNMQRVAGHTGNYGVKLWGTTGLINCKYAQSASTNGVYIYGGQPFHSRPDSLIFYCNYYLAPSDSAAVILRLFSGNNVMAYNFYLFTGNSGGNFARLSFPISYSSSAMPDSLMLGFLPAMMDAGYETINPNDFIIVDDVSFTPSAPAIINGGFENWFPYSFNELQDWHYPKFVPAGFSNGAEQPVVRQVLFANPDDHAAEISVYEHGGERSTFSMGYGNPGFKYTQGIPVHHRYESLNGYYQYDPENGDSMNIRVTLFNNDQRIAYGSFTSGKPVTSGFIPFDIPINYNQPDGVIPDSAGIIFAPASERSNGVSKLLVDKVSFDGIRKAVEDSTTAVSIQVIYTGKEIRVYPNPAQNMLTIEFEKANNERTTLQLYNLAGILVSEENYGSGQPRYSMPVAGLSGGIYLLRVSIGNEIYNRKISVIR